jgi:DNA polymerase/3'-5' exonuclease PolX
MSDGVAAVLDEFADYLKVDEQNAQARMYARAADNIRTAESIPPDPSDIKGIGDSLRNDVAEIQATGTHERLENLKNVYPNYENLRDIGGVGPVTGRRLIANGIESKSSVEEAIHSGEILDVTGIGPSTADRLLESL